MFIHTYIAVLCSEFKMSGFVIERPIVADFFRDIPIVCYGKN